MQTMKQDPNGLLDMLIEKNHLKNDAALARFMQVAPPVLSKLRKYVLPVGDSFVLRCVELAEIPLEVVRQFVPSPYAAGGA